MEIEEKLKLAFKQGMRYKNMWTEKHGYNEKFSFDNWLAENKQLLIHSVVVPKDTLCGYVNCEKPTVDIDQKWCEYHDRQINM